MRRSRKSEKSKSRRYQPNRAKLDKAISDILDKAINADSENAPRQLRVILLTENPQWKLGERRVARYLKRHLKARNNPMAEEIEADMDEETIYTMTDSVVAARAKEDDSIRGGFQGSSITSSVRGLDTENVDPYTDDNEIAIDGDEKTGANSRRSSSSSKPLFCDGLECVIS